MIKIRGNDSGFTLIELVIIILVLGVIGAFAVGRLSEGLETAQVEHTKAEMDAIAEAIVGNPDLYSDGARTSFGYVGDNGALPPTLQALTVNPGLATWKGPYISQGGVSNDYTRDGWGVPYVFSGTTITSNGSGTLLERTITSNPAALIANRVEGTILDADGEPPGDGFADSVSIVLYYPDGAGGTTIASATPSRNGLFSFASVPMGNHRLSFVYLPTNDTTDFSVTVLPGRTTTLPINLDADLW